MMSFFFNLLILIKYETFCRGLLFIIVWLYIILLSFLVSRQIISYENSIFVRIINLTYFWMHGNIAIAFKFKKTPISHPCGPLNFHTSPGIFLIKYVLTDFT